MTLVRSFLAILRGYDWARPAIAHEGARRALRGLLAQPGILRDEVQGWQEGIAERALLCHETSTHYKWFVDRDEHDRFIVWLHQYKPAEIRGERHAAVAHNHRYWFSSAIFAGGLHQRSFQVIDHDESGRPSLAPKGEVVLRAGDAYVVSPDEIHAMFHIEDGTLSLVVQGKAVRNYSEVFDTTTGAVTRFPDFMGQLPALLESVRTTT